MEQTLRLLRSFYGKVGHRGIRLLIYLLFFTTHILMTLWVELPSIDPNEFSVSAIAALFSGSDWSAAMSRNSYYSGYIQGALYTPIMLLTDDPVMQYRLMVGLNGVILSFIPVIIYGVCMKIGAQKPWQSGFCALVCGGYITYFAHSKFIWNETVAAIMPWLLAWLLFKLPGCRTNSRRVFLSALLGFVSAVSFAAHARLAAVILALFAALLFSRFFLKKRWVSFPVLFTSAAVFGFLQQLAGYALQQALWKQSDPSQLINTPEHFFANLGSMGFEEGFVRFVQSLCAQLYYLICSSWGMAALGISLLTVTAAAVISRRRQKLPRIFSDEFLLYGVFSVCTVGFMLITSVFYKFGSDFSYQDNLLFGRYLDGVIPFAVLFVMLYVFLYDLKLTHVLGGVIAACATYLAFYLTSYFPLLEAPSARISPILGFYPLLIGKESGSALDYKSLIGALSCGLCIMALLVVIISCARNKAKSVITAFSLFLVTVYSAVFAATVYLPLAADESRQKNAVYAELSSCVYNRSEAPQITVYQTGRNTAQMMQFLNQNTRVTYAAEPSEIPENTFVIVPDNVTLRFPASAKKLVFTEIGRADGYRVYAYGEKALAYVQSQ